MRIFKLLKNNFLTHQEIVLHLMLSTLCGMVGALIMMTYFSSHLSKETAIGTVNISGLVDRFVKNEADKNISPDELKANVKNYGQALNKELQLLAEKNKIILLPSEAVIAGSKDYTPIVSQHLKNSEDNHE
jgi:hypothetical protein